MTTRRARGDRGAAELAAVIGVTLILILLVLQVGLYMWGQSVATRAAHHGLDQTRVFNGSAADGEAVAWQLLDQTGVLTGRQVAASRTESEATVTVSGEPLKVVPGLSMTITATASGPVERIEP